MKARLPSYMQPEHKFVTEAQIRREIQRELNEAFADGQRLQHDVDLLAAHKTFKAGKIRLNRFNNDITSISDRYNTWHKDDPKEGLSIARGIIKKELAQLGVTIND